MIITTMKACYLIFITLHNPSYRRRPVTDPLPAPIVDKILISNRFHRGKLLLLQWETIVSFVGNDCFQREKRELPPWGTTVQKLCAQLRSNATQLCKHSMHTLIPLL